MMHLYIPPSRLSWCLMRALAVVALAMLARAAFGALP